MPSQKRRSRPPPCDDSSHRSKKLKQTLLPSLPNTPEDSSAWTSLAFSTMKSRGPIREPVKRNKYGASFRSCRMQEDSLKPHLADTKAYTSPKIRSCP